MLIAIAFAVEANPLMQTKAEKSSKSFFIRFSRVFS